MIATLRRLISRRALCVCLHDREAHRHYGRSTACSRCLCAFYRKDAS